MYKDCIVTVISDLGFHGKVSIRYLEENGEEVSLKFILNKNRSISGNLIALDNAKNQKLKFNTIQEMVGYLERIREKIYLIEVA